MKRQLISLIFILPLLCLFFSSEIYAQDGSGKLYGPSKPEKPSPPPGPPVLTFGVEKQGKLNPKTSKSVSGSLFEEMILNANSEDSLTFRVESESGNPALGLKILDKNNKEVPVAKDPSGNFKIATSTGGLPANGKYRVRVIGALTEGNALTFKLTVNRLGLTTTAFSQRFTKIYNNYRDNDPASVQATVAKLEELVKDDPSHSTAFERLGIIYLEIRKDYEKAEWAMDQAIKVNGEVRIRISYDNKWRQLTKLRSGEIGFEDKRNGWLRIKTGQVTLSDAKDKEVALLHGQQIQELSKTLVASNNMITITTANTRKPYIFAPEGMRQVDADLIVKLIQNHVVGKATVGDLR